MKKNKLLLIVLPFFVFASIFTLLPNNSAKAGLWDMQSGTLTEIETTFEDVGGTDDPKELIVEIIKVFLGFVGLLTVSILIWGGFRWMNAGGNDDELKQAKKIVIRAVIGLVIIIISYAIAEFSIYLIEEATDGW